MRIAFDLDNTLIPYGSEFPTIWRFPKPLMNFCGWEPLREGTIELMNYLKSQGNEIWIYTTSLRNASSVKLLFMLYGIRIDGVVNQQIHNKKLRNEHIYCSKYPPAFGIDVLIDDQEGVQVEAARYNFEMIWIKPEDTNWVEKVTHLYQAYCVKYS
jgi:hypothetical protein